MTEPLRIKFTSKTKAADLHDLWSSLIPSEGFEGVTFTFNPADQNYDFFVVYEGLSQLTTQSRNKRAEPIACSRKNTLLITTEPSSIRIDGPNFMRQFGHVLTSKAPNLTRHPNHISQTPPLRWFYGRPMDGSSVFRTADQLRDEKPNKRNEISTVCSTKQMSHTIHAARLSFVQQLSSRLPELDVFGRGIRPISDKAEAMEFYRYHIAIENHIEPGHWTEKLSDCFLAGCLPFYFGDPDYAKAFPQNAVIPINIFDLDEAEKIIRSALAENAYENRYADIIEARRRVLENHNTLGWVANFVKAAHTPEASQSANSKSANEKIFSRHAFRRVHPIKGASDLAFRIIMRHHHTAKPLQNEAIPNPSREVG